MCLGSLSCWKTQPRTIFNALTEGRRLLAKILRYTPPSIRCSHPVPFAESNPKAWCFQPHASRLGWCSWDCTPPSPSKHGEWSLYQQFLFWSHLTTWPSLMPPLDHPDGLWKTSDGPGHVLAWAGGPCARYRILIHGVVLIMVTVKTVVPALFRSLTRSSCVVLGRSLTFLRIIDTLWGKILHGAPVRGRLTVILNFFHFLIIAPSHQAVCLLSCSPSQPCAGLQLCP